MRKHVKHNGNTKKRIGLVQKKYDPRVFTSLDHAEYMLIVLIRMYIRHGCAKDKHKICNNLPKLIKTELKRMKTNDLISYDDKTIIELAETAAKVLPNIVKIIISQGPPHNIKEFAKNGGIVHIKSGVQRGGFFFKSLEAKGDKPITGTDVATLLDEIQQFLYNAKYTSLGRDFMMTDTLLSLLRGDTETFKGYLKYQVAPRYYMLYPPFIKFDAISKEIEDKSYEDFPDFMLAYQTYTKLQNQFLIDQGLASPDSIKPGFWEKFATKADTIISGYGQLRRQANLKTRILM
jgi:hypothetical protein